MSITREIRSYADTAIEQGRQALGQAQSQLTDVTGAVLAPAGDFVADLRAQAGKAISLDAVKTAVEPYLAQANGYRHSVTDRAEVLLETAKKDPRVAKAFGTAESVTGLVRLTVQDRVVKPARAFAGRAYKPAATSSTKPAATKRAATKPAATKPAATKPATTRAAATKAPATKAPARKSAPRKSSSAGKTTEA